LPSGRPLDPPLVFAWRALVFAWLGPPLVCAWLGPPLVCAWLGPHLVCARLGHTARVRLLRDTEKARAVGRVSAWQGCA
jgi:hypothetical protein